MRQTAAKAASILVADDHTLTRRGLRNLLAAHKGWRVQEVSDGAQALEIVRKRRPDLVVLDISMPNVDGLEATASILRMAPELPVLILSMHDDPTFLKEALKAGARGYVLKSCMDQELLMAVESLLENRTFFASATTPAVLEQFRQGGKSEASQTQDCRLGSHDREMVRLLATGKSNKETAEQFRISTRTAEYHRAKIMRKLGLHSLTELVAYAIRNKIVEP